VAAALEQILHKLQVNPSSPRVPNPVNPLEDFADKWKTSEGRRLKLEENFFVWLEQAKRDLGTLLCPSDHGALRGLVQKRFGVLLNEDAFGSAMGPGRPSAPAVHIIRDVPPKPWSR
jgi:hypothetical protein